MKEKIKEISENIVNLIKRYKKVLIIILAIVAIIFVVKFFVSNNNLSIDISSTNVNYSYSPNGQTTVKLKVNDEAKLKIITKSSKKGLVKCYSDNKDIIKFDSKDTFKAINSGEAEIYCKLLNTKSNIIKVKVGG